MSAYSGGELGEAAHSVPRELLRHATRKAWLAQLGAAGLPVEEAPIATPLRVDSVERTTGDPQLLAVREREDADAWRVDRRTLRVNHTPSDSRLETEAVLHVADLADRAQLELGRPITLSWIATGSEGRVLLVDVEPLSPRVCFSNASYRRIFPLGGGEGTLSPLSIDILDQALRTEAERGEEVVRRIYGRAYRRQTSLHVGASSAASGRVQRAVREAHDALRDLALLGTQAVRFRRELARAFAHLDAVPASSLDNEDLVESLDERVALVVESLRMLERSRQTTLSLLPILTRVTGPVSRDLLTALAEPIPTPERLAIHDRLVALGQKLVRERGELSAPGPEDSDALQSAFARAFRSLQGERPLGMDVRPGPFDESPQALLAGVRQARSMLQVAPQARRREAERELLALAAQRGPWRGGMPAAQVALLLLRRIDIAKGVIAEGLSHALLRVRAAVRQAGVRLADEGVIDQPEDVFYLEVAELGDALRGELGAYAARSRFRREDDQRWRNYAAPDRIHGRRG